MRRRLAAPVFWRRRQNLVRNVLAAVAERRDDDDEFVQMVVEIPSERPARTALARWMLEATPYRAGAGRRRGQKDVDVRP